MNGLLGNLLNPNPDNGLLNLSLNLAQAGGSGQPFMSGLAGAVQQTRDQTQQMRQQAREQQKQQLLDKALAGIDPSDSDLQLAAALGPEVVGQMLVARQRAQYGGLDGGDPASIREWDRFNAMSPDDQKRYLAMKRAQQVLDQGSGYNVLDPRGTGETSRVLDKDLAPNELPQTKEDQALGTGRGSNQAAREAAAEQKVIDARSMLGLTDAARLILENESPTGSWVGKGADIVGSIVGVSVPGAGPAAALATVGGEMVTKVPRLQGPQSDRDAALYRQMAGQIGDDKIPRATRLRALAQIEQLNRKYAKRRSGTDEWFDSTVPDELLDQSTGGEQQPSGGEQPRFVVRTGLVKSGPNAGKQAVQYSDGSMEYR